VTTKEIEAAIDRLYQGPLSAFTAERNALAKRAGGEAPRIKSLTRPTVPAWAVNQLHWRKPDIYDALVTAAARLRKQHRAAVSGRSADLREADAAHARALSAALKETLALLEGEGHPVTSATQQAVSQTLQALPADDKPGRLAQPLRPAGFEILAGITSAPSLRLVQPPEPKTRETQSVRAKAPSAREVTAAKKEVESARQAAKDARQRVRQHEADVTKMAARVEDLRERERRARTEWEATQARVSEAQQELARLQRSAPEVRAGLMEAEGAVEAATERLTRLQD
jgi:hypothetical protein